MPAELPYDDWKTRDAGQFTKNIQQYFLHSGNATPRQMLPFLDFLDLMVDESQKRLNTVPDIAAAKPMAQADIKNWRKRSKDYRDNIESAMKINPDDPRLIVFYTSMPLILGQYPDGKDTIPDAVEPIRIANQVEVSQQTMERAWSDLRGDLIEEASKAGKAAEAGALAGYGAFEWLTDPEHRWRLTLLMLIPLGYLITINLPALAAFLRAGKAMRRLA